MIKFILLFLILPLVHAEKPWKQCYGVEYLHYDKHCCDTQDGYSDSDRHCIESLPKLEYDKAITVLNSTLHAMTICNSANTCSEDIDFLEIVRQVENLHNITNGGATLAEGAADHLEAQSANLNTINTGILPSISLAPAATLHSLTGSSIIVQSGATFDFPSIQFTGTANDPSVQAHLEIGSIESQVDFHTHELSDVNLEENTLRLQHAPVTISASELNVLQNASVSAAELSKLVGMDTTTQELNQLAGLALTSQQVASVHGLPIDYTASATTRYAGSTASTLSEAKDACDADAQCDGYSDTWSQSLTFSITNGKVMPGSRGTHTAMPNNHISDCTNLITDNSHYGILVDTGSNTCQLITDGNRDASTWTDDASKKLYVRNSEISYGAATTGLPVVSYVKGIGRSAASKVVTADINGNVQIMQDVTIEGDLDVPVGEINIEGTALVVTAVQLNQAGQLHGELTASLQEINTLDGVLSTVAELNTMSGVTADTADLNRADITTPGISAASKVVTADVTGKVVLQDAQASVDASVFNLNGASVDAATLNKASGLTAPLNTINNALLGAEAMTFNVDLSVDALNVAEGNLKIGTEAIAATAAEMNVLDGVTLTTQQLSKLKTMPTTIDTTVVNGLYATTAELNYVDLAGSIGSAEASKVISSDATTLAKIQVLDAATVDAAMTYSLRSTGDYDPKMTLQDCQDAAIGTFTANINTAAAPKGCVHITGLRLYNEHATGSGTCAGVYACIVKGFAAGELKIKGANMPSAEVLNHLDVTLQATHDSLNHWQSLDAAVLASHLNPMQGLAVEKEDLDRLVITTEGQVEASKVVTTDASDALEFGVSKRMIMTSSTDAIEVSSLAFEADVSPTAMNKMDAVDATTEELNYAGNMLTADASANVGIAGDVSVTGAIEIGSGGSGRIGLGGTDIVINAVQLDSALSLHKSLTITAAEANTLDNIQATTAELNKMAGAQVTTAELNYLDTTVGTTEASKAAIYGSELLFADLASTEIDAATLKLSGVAVTSTASELNIASGIPSDLIPELNKLSSAPSTALLNTFAATTASADELNVLDAVDPDLDIADLNKLKDLSSTATELNKLGTASSAAQLNAMSTTATAAELNAAGTVLVAGSDAAISVTDATIATLDTTNIANDLTVTAAELDAHAADLGSVLSSGITAFTSASNIDSIDKLRAPSTAQYNMLAGLGSASDLNTYSGMNRVVSTTVSSDFCDNKLPGTLVSKENDLYMCIGDECAETSTCEYRRPACFNGAVETSDDQTSCISNGYTWDSDHSDKTVFKTRTCSHDMQHYTGLRDECPVGKCRIDERHQVKKTCHQDAEGSIAFNGEIGVAAGQCERKYEYSDSTAVFSGTACTDASDCETQCAADANCEGYTSRCDDPSKTTEDTCGTCLDPAKTSESTCGDCPHLGYQASAVTSHTTPDTSGWPAYDCSSPATSGTFILNGDCTLSAEVILDGDLTIVGSSQDMSTLKTMTAASTKRHFKVDGGRTLELWYVKLTGGDVSSHSASTDPSLGGAIFTSSSNGNTNTVNVYFSEISGNKAYNGGGIYSRGYDDNQLSLLNIRNSIVKDNVATGIGGGISGRRASITIMDTTIDDNEADYGGGLQLDFSVSTVTNTIISNNEAVYGGAITILNVIGATILRQVTFDGNEATTSNDEIFGWGNDEDLFLINTVMPSDAEIGDFDGSVVPISITCSDNPCTVAPYTGACAAVDANNDILGVTCAHYSTNENTCGTCDDTSLITKTNCEASGTWTSAWNAGTWTAGVWADIGSAYAFGESTGTGGSSKQRDDATLAIEVTEDCTSSASVHCSDPEQVTTNTYGYASSVKVFDGASCSDLADCQQQCTDNPSCEGYTSACSLVDKITQDTCGTCDVAGKSTELTCGTCVGDTSKETEATCVSECQDSSFTTEATCGTCDDTNEESSTTCVDTCYDYSSSTKVFDGASCNDLADCQQQCTDDLACEGYTSQCSLSSKTTEETCGSCSDSTKTTETTCGACDKGVCSDATRQPDDCLYNFVQNTDLASAVANTVDLTITEQECRDIQAAYDATATFNVATNDAGPRGCVKLAANTNYYYRANGAHSRTDCTTAAAVCSDTSYTTETTCEAANKIWTAATFSPTHVCIKKSGNTVSTLDSSTTCVGTCSTSNYNTAATCGTCNDANMLSAATCVGTGCFSDTSQTTSGTCLTAGFSQNTITNSVNMAFSVYAADLDGDGDIDVLSASYSDNKIAWYKNDGSESFTAYTITTSATGATSVYAADVDGDGDMDVLSSSNLDDTIRWYENDGLADPTFTARTISTDADGAWSVYAADVDGDGDMDVLSASPNDNTIRWYENDGNSDPTFTARTITTSATGARSVYAADVDGDGDMDVLSASFNDHKIAWYENDGSESFTAHTITTSALGAYSVYAADVDGDGDMDVLSASGNTDEPIVWYENNGNSDPTFTARTITTADEYDQYYSVYAADVDGDGDMDVLSASDSGNNDDKIAWYENDGAADPTFTAHTITTLVYGAHAVYAVDVDGDGDMDVLSASTSHVNRIAWYENDNTWTARTWSPLTWVDRTWTADTWTAGTWDTQLSSIYAYGTESTYTGGTSQERSVASSCAGVPASRRFPRTWSALSWTQRDWQVGSWENGEWDTQLSSVYAYGTESTYTGGTSQARSLSSTELTYEDTCPSGTSTSSVSCLAMETPPTAALFTSGSQDFSLNAAECEQFAADNNYIFELRNDNNINQVSEGCILRNANWEDPQKIYYVDPDYTGHDQNGGQYYDCGSVINANINYPCVKRLQCPSTHVYGSYAMAYEPSCTASDYKTCEAIAAEDKTLCLEQGCADGSTKDKAACEAAGESYDSSTAANVFYHTEQVNSEAECDGEHTWGYKKFTIRV